MPEDDSRSERIPVLKNIHSSAALIWSIAATINLTCATVETVNYRVVEDIGRVGILILTWWIPIVINGMLKLNVLSLIRCARKKIRLKVTYPAIFIFSCSVIGIHHNDAGKWAGARSARHP